MPQPSIVERDRAVQSLIDDAPSETFRNAAREIEALFERLDAGFLDDLEQVAAEYVVTELEEKAETLGEELRERPEYKTAAFKCLRDYQLCTEQESKLVCISTFLVCLAAMVLTIKIDGS